MKISSFLPLCVALGSSALIIIPACTSDTTIDEEPILPGVGPIGMGGNVGTTGGAAGAGGLAGTGGSAGSAGSLSTGGKGGAAGSTAGHAGTGGSTGGTSAGSSGTSGAGGGAMIACSTGTGAKVNVANLVPAAGTLDFCFQLSGSTSWIGPMFQCGGGAAEGLSYTNVSQGLALDPGTYDVRAVPNADCTATPFATATGLTVGPNQVVAVFGGAGGETPTVALFANDSPPSDGMTVGLRFLNALHGVGAVDVGLTDMAGPGASVLAIAFADVPFGAVSPPETTTDLSFPIDANGYLLANALGPTPQTVGAALTGTTNAIFSTNVVVNPANTNLTAFGVGTMGDATFPISAVVCIEDDTMASAGLLSCVSAM